MKAVEIPDAVMLSSIPVPDIVENITIAASTLMNISARAIMIVSTATLASFFK